MDSGRSTRALPRVSFLIRRSRDQRSVSTSPGLIAAAHVLHRLLAPRHPPCALVLLIRKEHVRCRYGVFKVRAGCPHEPFGIVRVSEPAPREGRSPRTRHEADVRDDTVLQSSTACGRPSRGPTRTTRSTCSRRTGSSDDAEQTLEPSTSPAASGVRAPDSLERR
jgi:hypothetical protein